MGSRRSELAKVEARAGPAPTANSNLLFETIICDLQWSSLVVGALAMMVSACSRPGVDWTLRSCRHLLHGDAKAMLLALRYGSEFGLDRDSVAKLNVLFDGVAEAKARLAPLAEPAVYAHSQLASLQGHRTVWRRLAAESSSAIGMLEGQVKSRLNRDYTQDAGTLRQFLRLAADGDSRAVDGSGVIHLPELRQRRRAPRIAVDRECELILPTGSLSARLKDVSRDGFAIVCDAPLAERQTIVVALPDGRRLDAVVVRRQGTNIGVSLRHALAVTDPLFRNQSSAAM